MIMKRSYIVYCMLILERSGTRESKAGEFHQGRAGDSEILHLQRISGRKLDNDVYNQYVTNSNVPFFESKQNPRTFNHRCRNYPINQTSKAQHSHAKQPKNYKSQLVSRHSDPEFLARLLSELPLWGMVASMAIIFRC